MEKLSEYIPLLVIIAIGIISSVIKKKHPVKGKSFQEEVFPTIPQLSPIYEESIPQKKVITPVASGISMPEKRQHPEPVYEQPVEIQYIDENTDFNLDFSDPEEVKKAIIYTEIFNKKDF